MELPSDGVGLQPEKLEEEKEGGPLFHCDLCDADIVYKIAQAFLPGLASACIDNTTGGLFKTPATVAVDIRREMVDYLIQRSENFVAESVVLEGAPDVEASIDPYDVISDFVDDFVNSKRNFFSRVSGWLLSEKREEWIDDLVQEMELNGFWLLNRRNTVAQTLLKNLDFKNTYHCNMNFKSSEDLEKHKLNCSFRTMTCTNEGCDSTFSAAQMEHHDSSCPFKMLQCEQNCPDIIMRREMDRHCITTCPMKLVKCPFYSVGCQSTVPQCTIEQHRSESLPSHLLYILQVLHKEASPEDLKERVDELEKLASPGRLASARDARSLTFEIKDLEAKLGPFKVKTNAKCDEEAKDLIDEKEEEPNMPVKHVRFEDLPSEKEATSNSDSEGSDHEDSCHGNRELMELSANVSDSSQNVRFEELPSEKEATANSHSKGSDHEESIHENQDLMELSTNVSDSSRTNEKEVVASISVQENLKESPFQREEGPVSPAKDVELVEESSQEEVVDSIGEEHSTSTSKQDKHAESIAENQVFIESPPREVSTSVTTTVNNEMLIESPPGEVSSRVATIVNNEMSIESPPGEERLEPINREVGKESAPVKEETDSLNSAELRVDDIKN